MYRDSLILSYLTVQKRLNQSKCSLGCWVGLVQNIRCGCRCAHGMGHFCDVWPVEKHCKA